MGSKPEDLSNKLFGRLTPVEIVGRASSGAVVWMCACACGGSITVSSGDIKRGGVKSCGCLSKELIRTRRNEAHHVMTGKVFGRLTVVGVCDSVNPIRATKYVCRCECFTICHVSAANLLNGSTVSCGCFRREQLIDRKTIHNLSSDRLYTTWQNMLARCYNSEDPSYHNYGQRGIIVCDEWINSVYDFVKWANASGYKDHLSIDRIDNDGNYEPGNCRWATDKEQARNKRNNVITGTAMAESIRSDSRTQSAIALDYGISQSTVHRVKKGYTWN